MNTRTEVKMTSARTIQKLELQRGGGGREEGRGVGRGALQLAALPRMGGRLAALLPPTLILPFPPPSLLLPAASAPV